MVRSANRECLRAPAPQRSGRMPFAGLSLRVSSQLRHVMLAADPLTMLALAALLVHKEKPAVIAVGCSPVLPFAVRRISVIASALVWVIVLSVTPLLSTKLDLIAVGLLALATLVRVRTGSLRVPFTPPMGSGVERHGVARLLHPGGATAVGEGDMRHADHDDTRGAIADGMHRLTLRNVGAARHDPGDRRHFRNCRQFPAELRRAFAPGARTQLRLPRPLPRCADRHLDRARQPSPPPALAGPCCRVLARAAGDEIAVGIRGPGWACLGALLAADLRNQAWSQLTVPRITVAGQRRSSDD